MLSYFVVVVVVGEVFFVVRVRFRTKQLKRAL